MGIMGLGKMGNLSQIVPFFYDFPPISYQFCTFFVHFPKCTFGNFSQFPISPHFSPFPPIFPHGSHFPQFSMALWLVG